MLNYTAPDVWPVLSHPTYIPTCWGEHSHILLTGRVKYSLESEFLQSQSEMLHTSLPGSKKCYRQRTVQVRTLFPGALPNTNPKSMCTMWPSESSMTLPLCRSLMRNRYDTTEYLARWLHRHQLSVCFVVSAGGVVGGFCCY